MRNIHGIFVENLVGKGPVGRPGRRWDDSRMDVEREWEGVDWIHLAQDTDQCENGNEPSSTIIRGQFLD
jgi:hypothetical protein